MKKKTTKPYWDMNTTELAAATREFDDPTHNPRAIKPNPRQRAQLRQWRKVQEQAKLTLLLDKHLIEQTDDYAATHGITFAQVVSNALRKLMEKKTA